MQATISNVVDMRNKRSVWRFPTQGFPGEHFATFPEELPRLAILAGSSEKGCCPKCGAPWLRIVEEIRPETYEGKGSRWGNDGNGMRMKEQWHTERRSLGWKQGCKCPAAEPVPCTVLDPFLGSGTTALVADRLGRHAIGMDAKLEYTEIARNRIHADAPMLVELEVIE